MNNLPLYLPGGLIVPPPLPDEPLTEYWLVFSDSTQWISAFLKPGFSHCYVLTRDAYNWMVINPELLYLRAEIAPIPANEDLISIWCQPYETVVKLTFKPRHTMMRFGICGMYSCVTIVRYVLGLQGIKALTPYRLYKKLLTLSDKDLQSMRLANVEVVKQGSYQCLKSETQ
jgi:hypothetical protein